MSAGSGELKKSDDTVFDETALLVQFKALLDGAGVPISFIPAGTYSVRKSAALETSGVVKASAGTLYKVAGRIDSTAPSNTYYLQLINAASVPVDGAVTLLTAPIKVVFVTGTDFAFDIDLEVAGIAASTGIVIVLSTTEFTKTLGGAYLSTTALYI